MGSRGDWRRPHKPPMAPCPATPSGRHRWREPWIVERRRIAVGEDLSSRLCHRCGAHGAVDKQGIVRLVDAKTTA